MANPQSWNSAFNMGSMSKPPTLVREEYPQWKIRMINFLNGHDRALFQSIVSGPHIPIVEIAAVPGTNETPEIPASFALKSENLWSTEDKKKVETEERAKSLLIMALPNDMFSYVDACTSAKEIWDQLEYLCEGGDKMKDNMRTLHVSSYERFTSLPSETLTNIYNRLTKILNELKKYGVEKSNVERNVKFS